MSFLNSLLLTLIKALHSIINNYALTIIVFTILIKLVVMPLNLKSRRSTMRMSSLAPKQKALQEKYKDDQEKLNQKLQELYRKEGVNPMGSCLPMLISMVILFAMFYALRTFANEQLVSQFLTFYHNPEIDPHTLVEPFLWIKKIDGRFDEFIGKILKQSSSIIGRHCIENFSNIFACDTSDRFLLKIWVEMRKNLCFIFFGNFQKC